MGYDDFLKKIPLFADLPDDDLEQLCRLVEDVSLELGEVLFEEGSEGDRAYVVKEGELEILKHDAARREVLLAVLESGEMLGEMSLLENTPRTASVRARTPTTLIAIRPEQLDQLFDSSPSAARSMLHTVTARWRATESMLRQSEKMAQLGTMSAGMAHELNNPAAAAQRGAAQLVDGVATMQQAQMKFINLSLSAEQFDQLGPLDQRAQREAANPSDLDSLARSDREYELETWLEDAGFSDAWELAPSLANMNYAPDELAVLAEQFSQEQLPAILNWMVASYNVYSLMEEIKQGAGRISEIVKSLKTYVYLDQAPVQEVDVHEGLDNTLVLMRGKLKGGIIVRREYGENLPRIEAYGSELNQVWTNLIDNAADAMGGQGTLTIRTGVDGDEIFVTIEDDGPGIPPEIVSKVFDPFFTTKPVGKGTGLGLNISYNIITQKHRGAISVTSEPGSTRFTVRLPIQPETT